MDKTVNSSGLKLLELCQSSGLMFVNGRVGDAADTGDFTFMSSNGSSLIDYVLMSNDFFHIIKNFTVHDFYSCSSHAPIQLTLNTVDQCERLPIHELNDFSQQQYTQKLIWDNLRHNEYITSIESQLSNIENIVDSIKSNGLDIEG